MSYLNKINSPKDLKKLNINSLNFLCGEIRKFLINSVSVTGGHLSSNLGVVELTVALHYCFNSPVDKIIWDVGHQAYIHKILTGRKDKFDTLRKQGGLSGFPKSKESEHDIFNVGHSTTSISAALGFAAARDLDGDNYNIISVIGDGSMTGGMSFEAMNNAGRLNSNFIVILNDNQMSISENVGAMSRRLNEIRTAPTYLDAKADVNNFLKKVPFVGLKAGKFIEKTKNTIKYVFVPGGFFEELGFTYFGPIDGHNIEELTSFLNKAKKINKPILLHVYTKKGKGYFQAENSPAKYHGVDSFCVDTGLPVETKLWDTYSDVFGKELVKIATQNKKVVAISASMVSGTGLVDFEKKFPERLFDVGITEAHAVTFSAGLAKNGYIPVFAVYSTFLQRSYDQILHDVCIQNLHVIFAIDRAGVVGSDGETHQGVFDLSYLSHMPNMTIIAPKNKKELQQMLHFCINHKSPIAIRYPRGAASSILRDLYTPIEYGKCEFVSNEGEIAILSVGTMMDIAFDVYEKLLSKGVQSTLINVRFVKPIDLDMVKLLQNYKYVYVIEDNVGYGGFGSKVLEEAHSLNININYLHRFAFPDEFIEQGTREQIFSKYGLDTESVYNKIISDLD